MDVFNLFLFSRKGCCLCKGLEERLRCLDLQKISPPLALKVIDVDEKTTPASVRKHYDLEVPVLVLGRNSQENLVTLPRVSPRLKGEGLFNWLQRACSHSLLSD